MKSTPAQIVTHSVERWCGFSRSIPTVASGHIMGATQRKMLYDVPSFLSRATFLQ